MEKEIKTQCTSEELYIQKLWKPGNIIICGLLIKKKNKKNAVVKYF